MYDYKAEIGYDVIVMQEAFPQSRDHICLSSVAGLRYIKGRFKNTVEMFRILKYIPTVLIKALIMIYCFIIIE